MIFFGLTTICCVLGFDFSLHNARRNLQYGRGSRIDVVGRPHNVETSGWKAMYSTRVPGSSAKGEGIFTTEETKVEIIAPSPNYHKTEGAIPQNTYSNENLGRRHFTSKNTNNENTGGHVNNKSSDETVSYNGYEPSSPDVLVVMPSSQFKTEVPSTINHPNSNKQDDKTTQNYSERQLSLEDIEKSNSYGDKIHADSFRVPRRIHPYSTASSMYLAQENLFVAPRAFQVDQLPSTPQLNAIMNRAMSKVKDLLHELEDDKGKILFLYIQVVISYRKNFRLLIYILHERYKYHEFSYDV